MPCPCFRPFWCAPTSESASSRAASRCPCCCCCLLPVLALDDARPDFATLTGASGRAASRGQSTQSGGHETALAPAGSRHAYAARAGAQAPRPPACAAPSPLPHHAHARVPGTLARAPAPSASFKFRRVIRFACFFVVLVPFHFRIWAYTRRGNIFST